jgi:hypothetical protein
MKRQGEYLQMNPLFSLTLAKKYISLSKTAREQLRRGYLTSSIDKLAIFCYSLEFLEVYLRGNKDVLRNHSE